MLMRCSKSLFARNVYYMKKLSFGSCFPSHLTVNDKISDWEKLGFTVDDCGCLRLNEITIKLNGEVSEGSKRGVIGWGFSGLPSGIETIGDIPVEPRPYCACHDDSVSHANGVYEIDHIVVKTSNWEKLDNTLRSIGIVSKKSRVDQKTGSVYMFYRPSKTILEVIYRDDDTSPVAAKIWGITFSCRNIDKTHEYLSGVTKSPWPAVQQGRRITTLQPGHRDISIALAFMSPHVKL